MQTTNMPPKCNLPWTLPERYQSGQFSHFDRFVIVDKETMRAVQSDFSEEMAQRSVRIFMEHDQRAGIARTYEIYPLPKPLHNWPATHWH